MIRLYNSLTKQKQDFQPIREGQVGMYSCGPTVYDHAHIGNLRSYISADLLRRVLTHLGGYDVHWVMNVTDIDDKMIDRLKQNEASTEPMTALRQLADQYIEFFKEDIRRVGIDPKQIDFIRATDSIALMQEMIRKLLGDGIAYVSDGSVFFSLAKYQAGGGRYGRLVNINYQPQARVTDDQDQKDGVADFALWKAKKEGEPSWDFELDGQNLVGRPGWHIECSAMSEHELGKPFDIHTGGVDLRFPHHENEIAQSGGELARYFVHNEHLLVEGQKMSKSLGNFKRLKDFDEPLALRYVMLQASYRNQLDETTESYNAAQIRLRTIRESVRKNQYAAESGIELTSNELAITDFKNAFAAVCEDDLNTPQALAELAKLTDRSYLADGFTNAVEWADCILGLDLVSDVKTFTEEEKAIEKERNQARDRGDYARSDELREHLAAQGIGSEDLPSGSLYWRM